MLTRSIFCRKSDRVYFHLLPALEDLDLVATWSWGRSALRWMYPNMRENRVYFHLLLALEDLDLVATQSWGRSALGWMYVNISEISSRQSPHAFVGLYLLWDVRFTSPLSFFVFYFYLLSLI